MYPGKYAAQHPDRPAFIMASTGEAVSYREFEARSNRLAHLLRAQGLKRLDHYAIFMENNNRFLEACSAGYRAGLYFTCINSFLTAEELAYIVNNSESQLLITSKAKLAVAQAALPKGVTLVPNYDRAELVQKALRTAESSLAEILPSPAPCRAFCITSRSWMLVMPSKFRKVCSVSGTSPAMGCVVQSWSWRYAQPLMPLNDFHAPAPKRVACSIATYDI